MMDTSALVGAGALLTEEAEESEEAEEAEEAEETEDRLLRLEAELLLDALLRLLRELALERDPVELWLLSEDAEDALLGMLLTELALDELLLAQRIIVETAALLPTRFGSNSNALMTTKFCTVRLQVADGLTLNLMVRPVDAPGARAMPPQRTFPPNTAQPAELPVALKVMNGGMKSLKRTPVAGSGPVLLPVSV